PETSPSSLHAALPIYPLRVPPLDRCNRHAVDQHLVVQVIAEREPGRTAASQLLALGHAVTELDRDRRKMSVERLQPEAVVEDHEIGSAAWRCRQSTSG